MKQHPLHLLLQLVVFVVLVCAGYAQTAGTGAISGTVTDPAGAVVTGADVRVIEAASGEARTAVTAANGGYLVALLKPGDYRVEVSKSGFKLAVSGSIAVHVTEMASVNIRLTIGASDETLNVAANQELLNTESSALGYVIDSHDVAALPLVTRNYTQILGLSAGVSAEVFNAGELGRGGVDTGISSGGSGIFGNNFQMNGVEINDGLAAGSFSGGVAVPNPDTLQEFKVQTSQFDASYGRNSGANVNVITKSGTNQWHGSAWEYLRNEALNANTYFLNEHGQPRARLRQNQFGGTLGGHIVSNKLLFFTSYQGTRQQNGLSDGCTSTATLPMLTNDRSAAGLAASVGPNTAFGGQDFLGRTVDASNISPVALALFNLKLPNGQFLIPNPQITQNGLGSSTFSMPCPYNEDQGMANLDWLQNDKSTFQVRFFIADSDSTQTLANSFGIGFNPLPGGPQSNPQNFRNFTLSHTYTVSNRLVNQAVFGFHRTDASTTPSVPFKWSDLGATVPAFDNADPVIAVLGGFLTGGGQQARIAQNTFVFQDTVSYNRGKHSIRFGGGYTYAQDNISPFSYYSAALFADFPSMLLGTAPAAPYESIDIPGLLSRHYRTRDGNLYFQDDIKLTSRLTVNLGFRFERLGDPSDINGRSATIDLSKLDPNPSASGSLAGFVVGNNFPGTLPTGVTSSGNNLGLNGVSQNTFSPRIGFSWLLPGSNRFVLRGGYGIFRQKINGEPFLQEVAGPPFAAQRILAPNYTNPFSSPFDSDPGPFPQFTPYSPTTALTPVVVDPKIQPAMEQKYSMNLQTQLAKDLSLEVGYAGARSTHLVVSRNFNQANLASTSNPIRGETANTLANIPLRVPYEGFASYGAFDLNSVGIGWYNSLQASLSKRFSHGLQFLASYTFARDLNNTGGSTSAFSAGVPAGDNDDPHRAYGPDSFIRPHRFVLSAVYDIPGPANRHSYTGQAFAGWKLSGVSTIQSGHRLSLYTNTGTNGYGAITDFANITPGCRLATSGSTTKRLGGWVDTTCQAQYPVIGFDSASNQSVTGWGNSGVGIITGPGQVDTDLSLSKTFPLQRMSERTNLEFRAEGFNIFNHPIFGDPDLTTTDAAFNTITKVAANPRVIQFAFRLSF